MKAAKFAEGGSAKKGPDFGGVMSEADKGDDGFAKGGKAKLKTGGIAGGKAPRANLGKAPRASAGPTAMKRGGSAFTAAHSNTMATKKGMECADSAMGGEEGKD